ncbi:apolipoprotein N-acyltransferase [Treponema phagedenis]|uniref:Apolipoprotein N-acyltransferase n=1 Tax=Treponema phagedenis TaxID=162 RepID=A0AAE6IV45_TREPH|nr:apolipoprotein N-acyltransferase [Treponema phagedenis]QEJ98781.1 apolipoprotein N-acyltransferase [Treponema phagedenis]QEK04286.1 apolipoprotein N-acyltransferase [Treponema phagedenis]QEK09940.1 apolipoprotein N-acyltransferase [Treponema phagedenis]
MIELLKKRCARKDALSVFAINFLFLIIAALLFAVAHPNPLFAHGFPPAAYIAFLPVFLLIQRTTLIFSFFWGALYGIASYSLFAYWLAVFHPVALYVVIIIYAFFLSIVFFLLKLADRYFPKYGFILQWLIWLGYEYCKTVGFLGFPYGIIGYSQWRVVFLLQIAAIFGVWAVSAIVVFPSAWLAASLKGSHGLKGAGKNVSALFIEHKLSACIWVVAFFLVSIFGFFSQKDYSAEKKMRLALIQPNSDPWQGNIETYKQDFQILAKLSDEALLHEPETELVVWPETAFIPRIDWHYRYREDRAAFNLVSDLLTYIDSKNTAFLIGNDDAIKANVNGFPERLDYNAALLFIPQKNTIPPQPAKYWKKHLVPFTEHFPYKSIFPNIHQLLIEHDTHFWEKGAEFSVFNVNAVKFSVPICFEDSFGYISREFIKRGAQVLINISNDAWAKSLPCQNQHLSMAVFRAVENRVSMVRATASGQTVAIDPNGRIIAEAEPFVQTFLSAEIPVIAKPSSLYLFFGDGLGVFFLIAGLGLLINGLIQNIVSKKDE